MFARFRSCLLPKLGRKSLEVFGSERAVEEERDRQRESQHWISHPLSSSRHYYALFGALLQLLTVLSAPLEIAFSQEVTGTDGNIWLSVSLFCDFFGILDCYLTFRMGYFERNSETVQMTLEGIRQRFYRTWFVLDCISAVSYDTVILLVDMVQESRSVMSGTKLTRAVELVKLCGALRFLRVTKLFKFIAELERLSDETHKKVKTFFQIVGTMMIMQLACHWLGCFQFFVAMIQGFPDDCWVVQENLMNATLSEKYAFSMFRALSQMTRFTYGSTYAPTNKVEIWFSMFCMLIGTFIFTLLISNAVSVMSKINAAEREFNNQLSQLRDYMAFRKLPRTLCHQIIRSHQLRYEGKWFDENRVFSLVSKPLKEKIQRARCADLLQRAPMFQNQDMNFINAIVDKIRDDVFLEGDIIIRQGAPNEEMFFIKRGQVMVKGTSYQKQLCDGDSFGELSLVTRGRSTETVCALSDCHLYFLSAEDFQEVLQEFPDVVYQLHSN